MTRPELAQFLELLYARYNRREYIPPDPLEMVYRYEAAADREAAGLIAAGLAYGRVAQILDNVAAVLEPMGASPHGFLRDASDRAIAAACRGFRHRWTTDAELAALLAGMQRVIRDYGSLEACFAHHHRGDTVQAGLVGLVAALGGPSSLLSDPAKNSACKRLHLYLRWMVRRDDVDPGVWSAISPGILTVPLDTHLHRAARGLGLTRRKQAGGKTAREITRAFGRISPGDPLKYDFVLTRFGIRPGMSMSRMLADCRAGDWSAYGG